ncbi:hypothetical protein Syun_003130 [Stephania yunnanensis]|uniref:UspA domain-containing protein n=1 Tax=Stephania yunnanensis TaxID=152371 RepID=A0AAP0L270_9MAGN
MSTTSSGSIFLRQLSVNNNSKRWSNNNNNNNKGRYSCRRSSSSTGHMEGLNMFGYCESNNSGLVMRKRVMVVVDQSSYSKHAMMWALTHLTNNGDLLTLLHIIPPSHSAEKGLSGDSSCSSLASSLGTLCKACKPEVDVEALVIQGPKLATILSQVKKLEVSVLVLGQKKQKYSSFLNCICASSSEDIVEQCINSAECLTLGVRKQSRGMGGYLISSRWQKNFWLLA